MHILTKINSKVPIQIIYKLIIYKINNIFFDQTKIQN